MITVDFDLGGAFKQVDAIAKRATDAIRPAAQAGAQVYYEAVIDSAPKSKKGHWFQGTAAKSRKTPEAKRSASYWFESGNLKDSVYQVYSKSDSTKDKAVYHIAWNHRMVPYGFMVAAGTKRGAKANDFVGKARKSVAAMAATTMLSEFEKRMKQ